MLRVVFRSNDPAELALARALLAGEGIEAFELDVNMSVLEGSIGILPQRIAVREGAWPAARLILREAGLDVPEEP